MRRQTFGELHARFVAELGASSGADLLRFALEEALSAIYDRDWPWSMESVSTVTLAPIVPSTTFSGTARTQSLVCSGSSGMTWQNLGRHFEWGEETYRIVDLSTEVGTGIDTFSLDRQLGETLAAQTVSFVRDEVMVHTSRLRGVWVDGVRAGKLLQEQSDAAVVSNGTPFSPWSESTPYCYKPTDGMLLQNVQGVSSAPEFLPKCVNGAVDATVVGGVYRYFFVRVDYESGLESPPGPTLEYTAPAGFKVTCTYDYGSYSTGGYGLRLYRSAANPTTDYVPMYQVGIGDAHTVSITDSLKPATRGLPRYMEAPHTVLQLIPAPDADPHTVVVTRNRPFNSRALDDDYIELGTEAAIVDLLRMFLAGVTKLRDKDTPAVRQQIISFRQQLDYINQRLRGAEQGDASGESYLDFYPGRKFGRQSEDTSADWVENLASPLGPWPT